MGKFSRSFSFYHPAQIGGINNVAWLKCVPDEKLEIIPRLRAIMAPMKANVPGIFKVKFRIYWVAFTDIWTDWLKYYRDGQTSVEHPRREIDLNTIGYVPSQSCLPFFLQRMQGEACNKLINMLLPRAFQKIWLDHQKKETDDGLSEATTLSKGNGVDTTTALTAHFDRVGDDCFANAIKEQFLGTTPTQTAPFSIPDVQTLLANTKQLSIVRKTLNNAVDYMNSLFKKNDESGISKVVYAMDQFMSNQEMQNVSLSDNYPLGATQSNFRLKSQDGDKVTFKAPSHGYLMFQMSVVPVLTPYMGQHSGALAPDSNLDYFNPIFENLGNIPIKLAK